MFLSKHIGAGGEVLQGLTNFFTFFFMVSITQNGGQNLPIRQNGPKTRVRYRHPPLYFQDYSFGDYDRLESPNVPSNYSFRRENFPQMGHSDFPHTDSLDFAESGEVEFDTKYLSRPTMKPAQPPPLHKEPEGYLAVSKLAKFSENFQKIFQKFHLKFRFEMRAKLEARTRNTT